MSVRLGIDLELHRLSLMASAGYFVGLHIRFTAPLFTFKTYDQAWIDHYTDKGYVLRDPMVAWGVFDHRRDPVERPEPARPLRPVP